MKQLTSLTDIHIFQEIILIISGNYPTHSEEQLGNSDGHISLLFVTLCLQVQH